MTPSGPVLPVDRGKALFRAGWIGGVGVVLLCGAWMLAANVRWPVMWVTERLTALTVAFLLLLILAVGAAVTWRGLKWLLLACWPRPIGIEIGTEALVLRLGPFGVHRYRWEEIQSSPEAVGDDETAFEADDEPRLPALHHPQADGDLADVLVRFSGAPVGALREMLAPRLLG